MSVGRSGAYHRVLKLARTIADLAAEEQIATTHVAEALQYRPWVAEGQNHSAKQASLPRRCKGK
jgi:predicted ATPase with chaperone activity